MEETSALDSLLEAELLARIARQDSEAFACFYDRTSSVLYSLVKSILRDPILAEDVLQEVYLQIWHKAEVFNPALGKPIAWAITLTRNKALDRLRSMKRRDLAMQELAEIPSMQNDASTQADSNVELIDAVKMARDALNHLPPKQSKALELALVQGMSHAEVAETMQEPLGTVKAWIRRGLIEIREHLREHCE